MKVKISYELTTSTPQLKDGWDTEKLFDNETGKIFWLCFDLHALNSLFAASFKRGGKKRALRVADRFDAKLLEKLLSGELSGEVEISA